MSAALYRCHCGKRAISIWNSSLRPNQGFTYCEDHHAQALVWHGWSGGRLWTFAAIETVKVESSEASTNNVCKCDLWAGCSCGVFRAEQAANKAKVMKNV